MRPIVFLDIDDVICLNTPYGGHHLTHSPRPLDLYQRLWAPEAVRVLSKVIEDHDPLFVITSSWMRLIDDASFDPLFRATGLPSLADRLHTKTTAPQAFGQSRAAAIDAWLTANGQSTHVILDDHESGTGLAGRPEAILCEVGVGLQEHHRHAIRSILT